MKATEILEWIVKESISGEFLNFVDVPEEGENEWQQNEEWWNTWCGSCPPHPIPSGRYMYYYPSAISYGQLEDPDATIEIPCDNGWEFIHLYKVED